MQNLRATTQNPLDLTNKPQQKSQEQRFFDLLMDRKNLLYRPALVEGRWDLDQQVPIKYVMPRPRKLWENGEEHNTPAFIINTASVEQLTQIHADYTWQYIRNVRLKNITPANASQDLKDRIETYYHSGNKAISRINKRASMYNLHSNPDLSVRLPNTSYSEANLTDGTKILLEKRGIRDNLYVGDTTDHISSPVDAYNIGDVARDNQLDTPDQNVNSQNQGGRQSGNKTPKQKRTTGGSITQEYFAKNNLQDAPNEYKALVKLWWDRHNKYSHLVNEEDNKLHAKLLRARKKLIKRISENQVDINDALVISAQTDMRNIINMRSQLVERIEDSECPEYVNFRMIDKEISDYLKGSTNNLPHPANLSTPDGYDPAPNPIIANAPKRRPGQNNKGNSRENMQSNEDPDMSSTNPPDIRGNKSRPRPQNDSDIEEPASYSTATIPKKRTKTKTNQPEDTSQNETLNTDSTITWEPRPKVGERRNQSESATHSHTLNNKSDNSDYMRAFGVDGSDDERDLIKRIQPQRNQTISPSGFPPYNPRHYQPVSNEEILEEPVTPPEPRPRHYRPETGSFYPSHYEPETAASSYPNHFSIPVYPALPVTESDSEVEEILSSAGSRPNNDPSRNQNKSVTKTRSIATSPIDFAETFRPSTRDAATSPIVIYQPKTASSNSQTDTDNPITLSDKGRNSRFGRPRSRDSSFDKSNFSQPENNFARNDNDGRSRRFTPRATGRDASFGNNNEDDMNRSSNQNDRFTSAARDNSSERRNDRYYTSSPVSRVNSGRTSSPPYFSHEDSNRDSLMGKKPRKPVMDSSNRDSNQDNSLTGSAERFKTLTTYADLSRLDRLDLSILPEDMNTDKYYEPKEQDTITIPLDSSNDSSKGSPSDPRKNRKSNSLDEVLAETQSTGHTR